MIFDSSTLSLPIKLSSENWIDSIDREEIRATLHEMDSEVGFVFAPYLSSKSSVQHSFYWQSGSHVLCINIGNDGNLISWFYDENHHLFKTSFLTKRPVETSSRTRINGTSFEELTPYLKNFVIIAIMNG